MKEMYGYNFSQMIAYVVIASLVGRVVNTGVENTINNDIHSGGLAKYLVKPIGYIPFRMINTFGTKLFSLGVLVVFAVATITVLHLTIGFTLALEHLLLFIPALLLGLALNFFVFFIVSMMAFWLTEVGAFFMTIQVIIMVLSGGVFPITVLGDGFCKRYVVAAVHLYHIFSHSCINRSRDATKHTFWFRDSNPMDRNFVCCICRFVAARRSALCGGRRMTT